MLVAVEGQVLPDELIDDQVLIRQIWPVGWRIIQSAENFSSYSSSNLREYSAFF